MRIPEQFDAAGIRIIEILNDRGYSSADPQPQTVVWERMNLPIARGLRGLLYVLSDLSQVDLSDLSVLFAGHGRLRIGFAEIDPPDGADPTEEQVQRAVRTCWDNPYSLFSKPVGTLLICIQGQWSNVVDGRIKGGFAALATADPANATYNPLHAFAPTAPKPWGVTALFGEYTGVHPPLEVDWLIPRAVRSAPVAAPAAARASRSRTDTEEMIAPPAMAAIATIDDAGEVANDASPAPQPFTSLWDFALALNRNDPAAMALAADGVNSVVPIDGAEIRKLLGTVWFRSAFRSLSMHWRQRLLEVLLERTRVPNHAVRDGRRPLRLQQLSPEDLQKAANDISVPDAVRADVQLLAAIASLWGADALARVTWEPAPDGAAGERPAGLAALLRSRLLL